MANVLVEEQTLTDIANAIREKNGTTDKMKPGVMAETIANLPSGDNRDLIGVIDDTITKLDIPNNTTKIADYCFYKRSLKSVYIPDSINRIGEYAFNNCSNLKTINFSNNITSIGKRAFSGCSHLEFAQLPNLLTSIDDNAFSYISNGLTNLKELPNGITNIDNAAFANSYNLSLTYLPEKLIRIGLSAFWCTKVAFSTIPASVETLEYGAFRKCELITNITFKGTPTSINSGAFHDCTNLTTINVPWAEGEVANAPWGATNATINYNYVAPESEA